MFRMVNHLLSRWELANRTNVLEKPNKKLDWKSLVEWYELLEKAGKIIVCKQNSLGIEILHCSKVVENWEKLED